MDTKTKSATAVGQKTAAMRELRGEIGMVIASHPNPEDALALVLGQLVIAAQVADLCLDFKRIDLGFLESRDPRTDLPRFASLPAHEYEHHFRDPRHGFVAIAKGNPMTPKGGWNNESLRSRVRFQHPETGKRGLFLEVYNNRGRGVAEPGEVVENQEAVFIAFPPSPIPSNARKLMDSMPGEKFVTWEATWKGTEAIEVKDPILYTVFQGQAFVLAQWDMTKLESYISSEFTEG